ncbi:Protein transport protein TIP20 [Hanseniaspora osmophila]|uniref:Protein transport protein TIP20 n=1 Tax=Hanseniaspora osmophila TaxID=56408 RepID=A0A1E5RMZ5_9ASCO|nr:Protein transport protein TIP20 [Hanseniaspora osmophila]
MIESVEAFDKIPELLSDIEQKRVELSSQLQEIEQHNDDLIMREDYLDNFASGSTEAYDLKIQQLTEQLSKIKSLSDLESFISTNKNLQEVSVVKQLKQLLQLQQANENFLRLAEDCNNRIIPQIKTLTEVSEVESYLNTEIFSNIEYTSEEIAFIKKIISEELYGHFLSLKADLTQNFNQLLLETNWDSYKFNNHELIHAMKAKSNQLYQFSILVQEWCPSEPMQYWNFESLANNFKIKFIYHFNNTQQQQQQQQDASQSIETFFSFMETYLSENLLKCIAIFHDEAIGLTKLTVHDQFINYILGPLRKKIKKILTSIVDNQNNLETLVRLITQIFKTDEILWEKYSYSGDGLITLLPNNVLKIWIQFETDIVDKQYAKNFSNYQGLSKIIRDGPNFVKYLLNLYNYFHPFLAVTTEKFFQYKIMVFKKIFLNLLKSFRESNMNYHQSHENDEITNFNENVVRLKNMISVYETMYVLEKQSDCIILNTQFNEITESHYETLFQAEMVEYQEAANALLESLVHRFKKMFGNSLRTYFKVNTWPSLTVTLENDRCSNELIGAVNILSNCYKIVQAHLTGKMNEKYVHRFQLNVINITVDYLMNYIVKLNNFSINGYKQIVQDYNFLKKNIGFEQNTIVSQNDGSLIETLKLYYSLTFEDHAEYPWLNKDYAKFDSNFVRLKRTFNLKYAKNEDISYILYKCL